MTEKSEDNPENWKVMDRIDDFDELCNLPPEFALFTNGIVRKPTGRLYNTLRPFNRRQFIITRYMLYAIIEHYNEFDGPPNKAYLYKRMKDRREQYGKRIVHKLRNTPFEIQSLREPFVEVEYKCMNAKFYNRDINADVINIWEYVEITSRPLGTPPRMNKLYGLNKYGQKVRALVNQGYVF